MSEQQRRALFFRLTGALASRNLPLYRAFCIGFEQGLAVEREWQGLMNEERKGIFESMPGGLDGFCRTWGWLQFSKALETALKEKNS